MSMWMLRPLLLRLGVVLGAWSLRLCILYVISRFMLHPSHPTCISRLTFAIILIPPFSPNPPLSPRSYHGTLSLLDLDIVSFHRYHARSRGRASSQTLLRFLDA